MASTKDPSPCCSPTPSPVPKCCEQTSKGQSGDFVRFARFSRNHFLQQHRPAGTLLVCSQLVWRKAVPTFARLLASDLAETVATISRDWPAMATSCFNKTGRHDALFVEAQPITSRAIAWIFHRQSDFCCKTKNRTILVEQVRGWTVAGPVQWLWLVAFCCACRFKENAPQVRRHRHHKCIGAHLPLRHSMHQCKTAACQTNPFHTV